MRRISFALTFVSLSILYLVGTCNAASSARPLDSGEGGVWMRIHDGSGTVPGQPPFRFGHSAFLDTAQDRLLIFGGMREDVFTVNNDTWGLSLSDSTPWVHLTPNGTLPSSRLYYGSVFDSRRGRQVIFGGRQFDTDRLNDLWAFDFHGGGTWSSLSNNGAPGAPPIREEMGAIYDSLADRIVIFGGYDGVTRKNDVWWRSLGPGSPPWILESTAGQAPPLMRAMGCAYDPVRQSMWVMGGEVGNLIIGNLPTNGVWRLSLASSPMEWIPVSPAGTPPGARWGHSLVYDEAKDRLIVFSGPHDNEVWALSLSGTPTWTQLAPGLPAGSAPRPRMFFGATFDAARRWLIVDGGVGESVFDDTWAFALDRTTPAAPSWIGSENIQGGVRVSWYVEGTSSAEVQRRSESTDWSSLGWQSADGSNRIVYDDLSVAAGGRYEYRILVGGAPYGETWVRIASGSLALTGFTTNPVRANASIAFQLATASPAQIDVIDLKGRLVCRREVGGLGPGDHSVVVEGLSNGVYWIQLRQGTETRRAKGIVLR